MMSALVAAANRLCHLRFWLAAGIVVGGVSFSATSMAATSIFPLQVTAVVQNTCSMAVTPPVSAQPAVPRNVVSVNCQYGQAYTVSVEPAAIATGTAPVKSASSGSGDSLIVTVTY